MPADVTLIAKPADAIATGPALAAANANRRPARDGPAINLALLILETSQMPIFQVDQKQLKPVSETTFGAEGIMERKDIQRMLRDQISVLDERLMVISEEFCAWLDSSRRIDLLCLDTDANLVVLELKRTEDGGHMELQALRYAAMLSAMTFDQLVEAFATYRNRAAPDLDGAKAAILQFLGWEDVYEDQFGQDTCIVLAAADFSKEPTTAVMWLIDRCIDIRCIRMKPYRMGDRPIGQGQT